MSKPLRPLQHGRPHGSNSVIHKTNQHSMASNLGLEVLNQSAQNPTKFSITPKFSSYSNSLKAIIHPKLRQKFIEKQKINIPDNNMLRPSESIIYSSFNNSLTEIHDKIKINQLVERLEKQLEICNGDKFEVFSSVFDEVIKESKEFGNVLAKIKILYEALIRKQKENNDQYLNQIKESDALIVTMKSKITKLTFQNAEISSKYNDIHTRLISTSDQLYKLKSLNHNPTENSVPASKKLLDASQLKKSTVKQLNSEDSLIQANASRLALASQHLESLNSGQTFAFHPPISDSPDCTYLSPSTLSQKPRPDCIPNLNIDLISLYSSSSVRSSSFSN